MNGKEYVIEIARLWNSGEKDEAKKLFEKSQMVIPDKAREFLKDRMKLFYNRNRVYIYEKPNEQHAPKTKKRNVGRSFL